MRYGYGRLPHTSCNTNKTTTSQGNDVVVHVDPGAPGAWLSEPFYTALKWLAEN
jgi:hypothetical protein